MNKNRPLPQVTETKQKTNLVGNFSVQIKIYLKNVFIAS